MARPEKVAVVESLSTVFQGARSVVLNDFTGLNVAKLSALRKLCRENKVDYRVVKNTLAKRGAQGTPVEELARFFDGPTAIAASMESENIPARILAQFAGENEAPRFKAALVEGRCLDEQEILALAKLPNRDVLLSIALAGIMAPANGLVGALQGTLRKLLYAMNAIVEKGNTEQSQ